MASKLVPKEIRRRMGYSLEKVAVYAGVCSSSVRLYEANPEALSSPTREKLDVTFGRLGKLLAARAAP